MRSGDANQFVAVHRPVAHRLLDEDIHAGFEQYARSIEMQIRRQQHMNCVQTLGRKHFFKRAVDLRDAELVCQGLGLA